MKKKSSQACKSVRKIQNGKGIEQQAKTKGDQKKSPILSQNGVQVKAKKANNSERVHAWTVQIWKFGAHDLYHIDGDVENEDNINKLAFETS